MMHQSKYLPINAKASSPSVSQVQSPNARLLPQTRRVGSIIAHDPDDDIAEFERRHQEIMKFAPTSYK